MFRAFGCMHSSSHSMSNSENPWSLPGDRRYLLIFDLHQNIAWLDRVLEQEAGNFDHLILGGDYFDSYSPPPTTTSVAETCARLNALLCTFGDRLTVLFGNHDMPYYVASRMADPGFFYHPFSDIKGYSTDVALEISKQLSSAFWQRARFFVTAHDILISHAGVAEAFWPVADCIDGSLERLEGLCDEALREANQIRHPILSPGRVRGGGENAHGGIIWQDWNHEFSDEAIPLPQIVGHTKSASGPRQLGRSWCLDGEQTCYGLLGAEGLVVRSC